MKKTKTGTIKNHSTLAAAVVAVSILFAPSFAFSFQHPGGLHSAEQLQQMRNIAASGKKPREYNHLFSAADSMLNHVPQPQENFDIPYYYANKTAAMEAKKNLSDDAFAAYTLALAYRLAPAEKADPYARKAVQILHAWSTAQKKVSGFDGHLVFCYCAAPMVTAAEMLTGFPEWDTPEQQTFKKWLKTVALKSANAKKKAQNNHGSWGLYLSIACSHYLDDEEAFNRDLRLLEKKIAQIIDAKGELPAENKRTNSGMWYTYFSLCPLTCAAGIATNASATDYFNCETQNNRSIKLALDTFFRYCQNPGTWPYKKPTGIVGLLHNLFHPSADSVKRPAPESWPANLYEAMLRYYDNPQWNDWLTPHRPIHGGRGWLWPSVTNNYNPPENPDSKS